MDAFFHEGFPMKTLYRLLSIFILLCLTACSIVLPSPIFIIVNSVPATATPSSEATQLVPTATVSPTASITPRPSATATYTASPSVTPSPSPTVVTGLNATTTANVNFRSVPSISNNTPLSVVLAGTQVRLVGRLADNSWARVILANGAEGWMYTQNLSITGNINSLPIVSANVIATPTSDPTPTQEIRSRISYNINGLVAIDKPYLLGHLAALCPTGALVMDNLALANEIYNTLAACDSSPPLVVHRTFDFDEGSEWQEPVSEFINEWNVQGYKHLIRYSTNEPSYGGNQSVEQFVANSVQLMEAARANGFTLAFGNFAVGTIRWEDIAAAKYDPMLRAINTYGHYLACHEYSQTVLPFGVGQWPKEYLLNPGYLQIENWPRAEQLPTALWDVPFYGKIWPPYYHLRRCDWFLIRADQLGITRPKIILTEFGWDSLSDIKPTIEPLRWQFGLVQYMNDLRGVNTYSRLWQYYWPKWSFGQAACTQLKWADGIYPDDYVSFQLFTWSVHPHWLHTDFSGKENPALFELHDCLENYARNPN